jgi:hypothetical protein
MPETETSVSSPSHPMLVPHHHSNLSHVAAYSSQPIAVVRSAFQAIRSMRDGHFKERMECQLPRRMLNPAPKTSMPCSPQKCLANERSDRMPSWECSTSPHPVGRCEARCEAVPGDARFPSRNVGPVGQGMPDSPLEISACCLLLAAGCWLLAARRQRHAGPSAAFGNTGGGRQWTAPPLRHVGREQWPAARASPGSHSSPPRQPTEQ